MLLIDLDQGVTLQAANEDDLLKVMRSHYEANPGEQPSDDEVRQLIAEQAYEATDS